LESLSDSLSFAWNVLKVALGLGFVIFIHELGHFLLAKWNGVKVEKFSIGFGPTLASFRRGVGLRVGTGSRPPGPGDPPTWGETEYILAALPLGGYVKMLGEGGEASEAGPTAEGAEPARSSDPRAYNNKSVWGRMGIITAGVIMNVFLGIACFAFVFSRGTTETPARVGGVFPGSPAYIAGLRAGDEIVAIDGRRDVTFARLNRQVFHSARGRKIKFTVRGPGAEAERVLEIEPRRAEGAPLPTIGLYSGHDLELAEKAPFQAPPGQAAGPARPRGGFEGGDSVRGVGPEGGPIEPVKDQADLLRKLEQYRDRPIVVQVARVGPNEEPRPEAKKVDPGLVLITVPPHHFVDFGLRLAPGPIAAIRADSPAQEAGLKPGDRIVAVDGDRDFDPMRLPDYCRDHAGKPVVLAVEAAGAGSSTDVRVTPDDSPAWVEPAAPFKSADPLDIPGLGLALAVEPQVRAVQPDSPAARAGIKAGDTLRSLTVKPAKVDKTTPTKPIVFRFDDRTSSWPVAFPFLQEVPWTAIELTTDKLIKPVAVNPEPDPSRFHPLRGLAFRPLTKQVPPTGLVESLRLGAEEALDNVTSIFLIFQGLAQRRVGADAFGGMIPIAQVAYNTASRGMVDFLHFLGMLSINLAVLNFLPIPPLDGGQFLFLAAEKVRGKPLPDAALNTMQVAGIVFVLGLILFINVKDIVQLVSGFF